MNLKLTHLYPENLNLYGDIGNVICIQKRCEWRGIDLEIVNANIGDTLNTNETDIYFMGGGQDKDQLAVVDDFHALKSKTLQQDLDNNIVFLGVCGGYQLMGHKFLMGDGNLTRGLEILGIETRAPGITVKQRCIGNLIAQIDENIFKQIANIYDNNPTSQNSNFEIPNTLVGFENHSGQTYIIDEKVKPLGKTIRGFGNNSESKYEGAYYKNTFGSYMHGSLVPKNPHFADYLIWLALVNKYKDKTIKLELLNDEVEYSAHQYFIDRFRNKK